MKNEKWKKYNEKKWKNEKWKMKRKKKVKKWKEKEQFFIFYFFLQKNNFDSLSLNIACRVQEVCESRGGRPGLSVPNKPTVSVDVKQRWTVHAATDARV